MAFILIADDDELIAELASQVLIDAGHACGWVTSGEECWTLLQRRRPDILLLDQNMPGISGVSLLRKLRQSENFYDLPVIMFTAMSGADDENQAIYAGAQDYIRKPFDPRSLTSRIQRILSKRGDQPQHTDLKTYLAQSSGQVEEERRPARRAI
ncbi:phosphate regulon transcriptional regulatory protein [Erythrobacter sp. NAP1]|uniref:response regulator n=1 Tax=Erythrobacter sp. NAP1 TaxID=237727 RepID=UPI0000686A35|nr:response regulator [Erythrobacter sp. NAP1]EAQ29875.1 phosphate regulon transcriptional regulatory protein [Erythrobacter sp. NAP1]